MPQKNFTYGIKFFAIIKFLSRVSEIFESVKITKFCSWKFFPSWRVDTFSENFRFYRKSPAAVFLKSGHWENMFLWYFRTLTPEKMENQYFCLNGPWRVVFFLSEHKKNPPNFLILTEIWNFCQNTIKYKNKHPL